MNDLLDEQRTMHMAEQYSDRRMMVNSSSKKISLHTSCLSLLKAFGNGKSSSIFNQTSNETTIKLDRCSASSSNGMKIVS
jgi:hypothetical protein